MTPAFALPDVTAQLGRLMTEGAGHAHTCPSRVGVRWGTRGEDGRPLREKSLGIARDRCEFVFCVREEERQLNYCDPSRFSPSCTVIENHVRGQSHDVKAATAAFSQNTARNK